MTFLGISCNTTYTVSYTHLLHHGGGQRPRHIADAQPDHIGAGVGLRVFLHAARDLGKQVAAGQLFLVGIDLEHAFLHPLLLLKPHAVIPEGGGAGQIPVPVVLAPLDLERAAGQRHRHAPAAQAVEAPFKVNLEPV